MPKSVVLFQPRHISGWQAYPNISPPLGLLHVGTPVSLAGYRVKIIDQRIEPEWRRILRSELDNRPLCLGISTMTGPQLGHALEVSRLAKTYGDIPVVWGGVHPTLLPEQTLQNPCVDIVVQGEGEETFLELVQAQDGHRPLTMIDGIWYKDDGHVKRTKRRGFPDLNRQPPLAYHLVDLPSYLRAAGGVGHVNFITSRGCPHRCAFCVNVPLFKRKWRCMDPELTVRRVREIVQTYNIRRLSFPDMNFFTDMDRTRAVLEGIVREDLNVVISKLNVCADTLSNMTGEDLTLLERTGCRRLTVGVESGSRRIQQIIAKPVDIKSLMEANRRLIRYSIIPGYLFMAGMPTETIDDLSESVSIALRLIKDNPNAAIKFSRFTPYPGTELFDMAVKHGLSVPGRTEDWISFNYKNYGQDAPWLDRRMRKFVEVVGFCSSMVGRRTFLEVYANPGRLILFLREMYEPLAKMRLKRPLYRFLFELRIAKLLGLYGNQM